MSATCKAPLLICAASLAEAAACRNGIARAGVRPQFEVLRTGIGARRARETLTARLRSGPRPCAIVSSGFAGAMDSDARVGTWTWGVRVDQLEKPRLDLAPPPDSVLRTPLPWRSSDYFTAPNVLTSPADIGEGIEAAWCVDMESYAWAEIARAHEIDLHVIRLISDTRDRPLPEPIRYWTRGERARALALMASDASSMIRFLVQSGTLLKQLANGWSLLAREWPQQ